MPQQSHFSIKKCPLLVFFHSFFGCFCLSLALLLSWFLIESWHPRPLHGLRQLSSEFRSTGVPFNGIRCQRNVFGEWFLLVSSWMMFSKLFQPLQVANTRFWWKKFWWSEILKIHPCNRKGRSSHHICHLISSSGLGRASLNLQRAFDFATSKCWPRASSRLSRFLENKTNKKTKHNKTTEKKNSKLKDTGFR